jgi:hypothetical protein
MIVLFHHYSSLVIEWYFLLNEQELYFFIEQDEIDWERHFYKIPFHLFEQDGISQKLNLTHTWPQTSHSSLKAEWSSIVK